MPGTLPGGHQNRDRRRQSDGAGTGHHQHRHPAGQREVERAIPQQPGGDGQDGRRHDGGDEDPRHPVRGPLDGDLLRLRLPDRRGDPGHRAVGGGTGHLDLRGSVVHRPCHDPVGDRPFDRHALPGQERLVHRRAAPHDPPVERHALAGAHANVLAPAHFGHRHEALDAVPHHARPVGSKGQQLGQGIRGTSPGAVLEPAAEADDGDDERGGIEEQHPRAARRERHHGGGVRGPGAEPDQAVHAKGPVAERGPERLDEGPAEEQANGSRQRELGEAPRGGGPEAAHRDPHRRAGEREGPGNRKEPVPPTRAAGRLLGRGGGRQGRLDPIGTGGFHRSRNVRREAGVHGPRVREAHREVAGEQAHLRPLDPRKVPDRLLDARDATGAVHPDHPGLEPAVSDRLRFRRTRLCSRTHRVARSIGTGAAGCAG